MKNNETVRAMVVFLDGEPIHTTMAVDDQRRDVCWITNPHTNKQTAVRFAYTSALDMIPVFMEMTNQPTDKDNVVSLNSARAGRAPKIEAPEFDFTNTFVANKARRERLEKERLNTNKQTLRSYRIKDPTDI